MCTDAIVVVLNGKHNCYKVETHCLLRHLNAFGNQVACMPLSCSRMRQSKYKKEKRQQVETAKTM